MAKAIIRDRRQITVPAELCRELGLEVGDAVELAVENGALDALAEIRRLFAESEVTEEQGLEDLRRIRRELNREEYGIDAG